MPRSGIQPLKNILEEFLKVYHLDRKLQERRIIESWGKVAGAMVGKHTSQLSIRKKKLMVRLDSPVIRQELMYMRENLVHALNEEAGGQIIEEIVLM
jgi:predicted nucleic acid-binding Zn ribbon protein